MRAKAAVGQGERRPRVRALQDPVIARRKEKEGARRITRDGADLHVGRNGGRRQASPGGASVGASPESAVVLAPGAGPDGRGGALHIPDDLASQLGAAASIQGLPGAAPIARLVYAIPVRAGVEDVVGEVDRTTPYPSSRKARVHLLPSPRGARIDALENAGAERGCEQRVR